MNEYIKRKKNAYMYISIYFSTIIVVLGLGIISITNNTYFSIKDITIWEVSSFLVLTIGIILWFKMEKNFLSPWIIFFVLSYMYWFGQAFLHLFGILPNLTEYNLYSTTSLTKALIYQTIGFGLMHLGAMFYKLKTIKYTRDKFTCEKFDDISLKRAVNRVAVIMFLCSAPYVISDLFQKITKSIKYGYLGLYQDISSASSISASFSNIVSSLEIFFVPSLFLLLAANKDNKKRRKFIIVIFILYIFGFLITGGRAVGMGLGLCLMLFYHKQIKPYRGKRIIILTAILILLLILIPVIGEFRGLANRSITELFDLIVNTLRDDNVFVSTLSSMGFSIFPMVKTMELIPSSQNYSYGIEYIATILAIIPSILLFGHSFASIAALPDWLRLKLNMDYGPGYSIIAESYYNFGWMGLLIMFFIGYVIQKFFTNRKINSHKILFDANICIVLYFLTLVVRNSTSLLFRNLFYGLIIPMLIIKFIMRKER